MEPLRNYFIRILNDFRTFIIINLRILKTLLLSYDFMHILMVSFLTLIHFRFYSKEINHHFLSLSMIFIDHTQKLQSILSVKDLNLSNLLLEIIHYELFLKEHQDFCRRRHRPSQLSS